MKSDEPPASGLAHRVTHHTAVIDLLTSVEFLTARRAHDLKQLKLERRIA
jgi:hypothetical protein